MAYTLTIALCKMNVSFIFVFSSEISSKEMIFEHTFYVQNSLVNILIRISVRLYVSNNSNINSNTPHKATVLDCYDNENVVFVVKQYAVSKTKIRS